MSFLLVFSGYVVSKSLRTAMDGGKPGSSHGILQARILDWVAVSSSSRDLPGPGIAPALAGRFFITEPPGNPTEATSGLLIIYFQYCCVSGNRESRGEGQRQGTTGQKSAQNTHAIYRLRSLCHMGAVHSAPE